MTDGANIIYGRLKEAAHISGYTFARTSEWLETLLADNAWRSVGEGFTDINVFLRSIDLSPFNIGDNRPGLVRRIKELQPDASNRAIASAVGVSDVQVGRDLKPATYVAPEPWRDTPDLHEHEDAATYVAPEPDVLNDPDSEPAAETKSTRELLSQSDQNDWRTPRKFLTAAHAVLGGIDLDPASSAEANDTVQAAQFYTEDDDGLTQPWKGRVWLNPPYGGQARLFVERLIREYEVGNVTAAIMLVNSHPTETAWFQQLFRHTICFVRGRIDFGGPSRDVSTNSTHGSALAYLGPDHAAFAAGFGEFGAVVRRV
jgi:phage N-6-adenine-methyltransferase